ETGGFGVLARVGAGLTPDQMHAERIDGYNPLAVIDAYSRKKEIIERGDGPVLLDTVTYRYSGHSPSDASSYREKSEIEEWRQVDSLITYREELVECGVATQEELDKIQSQIDGQILDAYVRAIDLDLSPRADIYSVGSLLERTMFSSVTMDDGRSTMVVKPPTVHDQTPSSNVDSPSPLPETLIPKSE